MDIVRGRLVECEEELRILMEAVEGLDPKMEEGTLAVPANLRRAIKLTLSTGDWQPWHGDMVTSGGARGVDLEHYTQNVWFG